MKKLLLLVFLFTVSFYSHSQISFSSKPYKNKNKINSKLYEKFKSSTTIFILPSTYGIETYEKILKTSWKVTPYKLVNHEEFNLEDYLDSNNSFIDLASTLVHSSINDPSPIATRIYFNIRLTTYNKEEIKNKLAEKKNISKEKHEKIFSENTNLLSIFYLFPKDNFENKILGGDSNNIIKEAYSKKVFKNYKPGFIKNYFQKMSRILESNKPYWLYGENKSEKLAELANQKLYIPSYSKLNLKYTPTNKKDMILYSEYTEDLFKKYKYPFFIENANKVSSRIMNGEDFYYLRYSCINTDRFIQVVNSITGEIIYREYAPLGRELKTKHLKSISNAIKKASRK